MGFALAAITVVSIALVSSHQSAHARGEKYFSPYDIALSPDAAVAYVSGRTSDTVATVDLAGGTIQSELGIKEPTGIALSADGSKLYVASYVSDQVTVLDTKTNKQTARIGVGQSPMAIALSPDEDRLYVCNRFDNNVSVVDLGSSKELGRIDAVREPVHLTVTPDGGTVLVSNLMPLGRNDDPKLAADITIIDADAMEAVASVRLPTGCIEVGEIICSPDGKYAYVVSVLARFLVPPTQIARGWINTNALSIIDLETNTEYATVLLDELDRGAANPFGMAMTDDGAMLYVSHTGCHEITQLDVAKLHEIIEATEEGKKRSDLSRDLTFLYRNGVTEKMDCGGLGPKGIALAPEGRELWVANYYSDSLTQVRPSNEEVVSTVVLADAEPDLVRRGEMMFHDAKLCFQQWQSCSSCHPDARADGLRWDLLNDGLGNPKNAKSMVLSGKTPPVMSTGIRDKMETAVEAGIKYILFRQPEGDEIEALSAYLASLEPEPSPYLVNGGKLSPSAKRGKKVFDSEKVGCATCHPGPLFTDLQMYDVGTRSDLDRRDDFDTPTLIEGYRTGPYLHDGQAVTMHDVLVKRNPDDKHGTVSHLSEKEIEDLIEYTLSL